MKKDEEKKEVKNYFNASPNNNHPTTINGAGIFEYISKLNVINTTTILVQSNDIDLKSIKPDAHIMPTITA